MTGNNTNTTESALLAFHGNQAIKDEYLLRVRGHRMADQLVKGTYWQDGKGCAVGCTIHSRSPHAAYEKELGIPQVLAYLEDRIFEGLPNEAAMLWPERFLSAIAPGKDLAKVWTRFALWMLGDPEHGTIKYCRPDGRAATEKIIELLERELKGETIGATDWNTAANAAYAAANAATAAYAAAYAAAYTAANAANAAYAAANAATAAYTAANAANAAYAAAYEHMAEKLIELLEVA